MRIRWNHRDACRLVNEYLGGKNTVLLVPIYYLGGKNTVFLVSINSEFSNSAAESDYTAVDPTLK